jgi:hypothetical protein
MRDTSKLQAPDRLQPRNAAGDRSGALTDVNAYGADQTAAAVDVGQRRVHCKFESNDND